MLTACFFFRTETPNLVKFSKRASGRTGNPNTLWDFAELCRHFDLLWFYTMPQLKINSFYRICDKLAIN